MKTLKVLGISGSGKTTLIKETISRNQGVLHLSYSALLKEYGNKADKYWWHFLSKNDSLILIDEHLEFNLMDAIRIEKYRKENTCGLLMLHVEPEEILFRRFNDLTRLDRAKNIEEIILHQEILYKRAREMADALEIPLRILKNATVEESIMALETIFHDSIIKIGLARDA
ncbi:MAG: hypothetical protein UT66_C0004G0043 [candidate division CPR2 bacterium GW2011_GWC1_39_9]|uniref:Uncharacterized protein n=1 Tax=candidate division CPR2 bacterium GW2011_GWC2_39_10 TaxID=1618345 RepID=A0A0G0M3H8_UNCC2|nr:MAG: hypothetical protein UT18_C0006G0008 [candidate division CPR2 bacterium GW2011_GWC2_39_10]KKR36048.1 MAG: hypothetical protein UT66_C0004G0043 [candidate division CPR2 bacterium GW2011_GWC1_39_9]